MQGLLITPFIDKDTGRLVCLQSNNAYFPAEQILSLDPLCFSQNAKPLEGRPRFGANVVGLKRQPVFTEQGDYLGRLGKWQFDEQGLFLTSIVVVDANLWRKFIGKSNPDFIVLRNQIRELTKRKIVVVAAEQLVKEDQVSYVIAQ